MNVLTQYSGMVCAKDREKRLTINGGFMKTKSVKQEILLVTGTSFAAKEWCLKTKTETIIIFHRNSNWRLPVGMV